MSARLFVRNIILMIIPLLLVEFFLAALRGCVGRRPLWRRLVWIRLGSCKGVGSAMLAPPLRGATQWCSPEVDYVRRGALQVAMVKLTLDGWSPGSCCWLAAVDMLKVAVVIWTFQGLVVWAMRCRFGGEFGNEMRRMR